MDAVAQLSDFQADIVARVDEFVKNEFPLARRQNIDIHVSLIDEAILDSMGVLELVTFIESEFDVILSDEDVVADNFESIASIAKFIEKKLTSDKVADLESSTSE